MPSFKERECIFLRRTSAMRKIAQNGRTATCTYGMWSSQELFCVNLRFGSSQEHP